MKASDKRKKNFDLYSTNLKNVLELTGYKFGIKNEQNEIVELTEPSIFCPLCMSLFTEKTLHNDFIDRLTIEHVPPESVGGKGKILTCKICNQSIGKNLDHHIQKELNLEPFLKAVPNSTIEGRLRINNSIPLKAKFSFEDGKVILNPIFDKNIKEHYDRAINEAKLKWDGTKLKIKFWGGNSNKARLAIIKSAYLEMFSLFGHIFLFNSGAAKIREQISNPLKIILPHSSIIEFPFDDEVVGVNIIKEPLNKICFLVVLKLKVSQNSYSKKIGVLIPGPDEQGWEAYCNIKKNEQIEAKLSFLSTLNCVKEKRFTLAFNDIWTKTKNQSL